MSKILKKEQFDKYLSEYYKTHYGERTTDKWYEQPAVNVWVFGRDNKIICLKSHMLTGEIEVKEDILPEKEEKKAMKKIGFIDYFLDEWHANNYPEFIKTASGGEFEVAYAWAMCEPPKELEGKISNKEWSEKYGVPLCDTMEEVIEKSDYLIVLSPNNPEMHEVLCQKPLSSGKLTYVDKTFAPDAETAKKIFAVADASGTKTYSSSALRFSEEYKDFKDFPIDRLYSKGSGVYEIYSIHQIEPIMMLMNANPVRVMYTGTEVQPSMIIEFEDGRYAHMYQAAGEKFEITAVDKDNKAMTRRVDSDFFMSFIKDLIEFFKDGEIRAPHNQTVNVIAVRTAGLEAMKTPFIWVDVEL